jgi:hypothetical protein
VSAEDQPSVGDETPPLDVIVARLAAGLGTLTAIAETFADADPLDTSEAERTALWRSSRLVDEAITVIDYPGTGRTALLLDLVASFFVDVGCICGLAAIDVEENLKALTITVEHSEDCPMFSATD